MVWTQGNSRPDSRTGNTPRVRDYESDTSVVAPEVLWARLAPMMAARASVRVWTPVTGKFSAAQKGVPAQLPTAPTAVPIYNNGATTSLLALDFDAKHDGPAAVHRDVDLVVAWIQGAGGRVVVDRSTSGGRHVLVPLSASSPMRRADLEPLLGLLAIRLPTLDLTPMRGVRQGCITPPGSPCREGGHRHLTGCTLNEAVEAFTLRSVPGLVARLVELLDPQQPLPSPGLDHDAAILAAVVSLDTQLPAEQVSHSGLPAWIRAFVNDGQVPDNRDRNGRAWTPSEARLSVLEHHAARGWTGQQVWDTMRAQWPGMWNAYANRADRKRRFACDWELAFDHARDRTATGHKSHRLAHKPDLPHTGGVRGTRRKLAAARKWVLLTDQLTGRQRWTALAVVNALAYGMSLTHSPSAAMGERWLSVAAGLVCESSVRDVLHTLRDTPGSPLLYLAPHNGLCGDEYTLVTPHIDGREVRAAEWEAYAARLDPIDPVWAELGRSAWHVWETMRAIEEQPGARLTRKVIAAAGRIALSTVDAALDALVEHALVDTGHGWVARTGRTVRQLGDITERADKRKQERIKRHRRERRLWQQFIGIVLHEEAASAWAFGFVTEFDIDAAWRAAVMTTGPPALHPSSPESAVEAAIALLQKELGATVVPSSRLVPSL